MSAAFLNDFSFEKLIRPILAADFLGQYWERKPLVVGRGQAAFYGDLLTLTDFDRAVATAPRRVYLTPHTDSGSADADLASSAADIGAFATSGLDAGGTLSIYDAEDRLPALGLMCRLLTREFGYRFSTRIFLTPAGARAFKAHYDRHDVFILQIMGTKTWRVEKQRRRVPRPDEGDAGNTELSRYHNAFELGQGDLLYIPRGYVHTAWSEDVASLHITMTVEPPTWEDLLHAAVSRAADRNYGLKRALPKGFLFDGPEALAPGVAERLTDIGKPAHLDHVASLFADEYLTRFAPEIGGQVETAIAGDVPDLDDRIGPRRGLIYRLRPEGDGIALRIARRHIVFPAIFSDAIRFALGTPSFLIRDIPGELTDEEKIIVVMRLMREGLVERKTPLS